MRMGSVPAPVTGGLRQKETVLLVEHFLQSVALTVRILPAHRAYKIPHMLDASSEVCDQP